MGQVLVASSSLVLCLYMRFQIPYAIPTCLADNLVETTHALFFFPSHLCAFFFSVYLADTVDMITFN